MADLENIRVGWSIWCERVKQIDAYREFLYVTSGGDRATVVMGCFAPQQISLQDGFLEQLTVDNA